MATVRYTCTSYLSSCLVIYTVKGVDSTNVLLRVVLWCCCTGLYYTDIVWSFTYMRQNIRITFIICSVQHHKLDLPIIKGLIEFMADVQSWTALDFIQFYLEVPTGCKSELHDLWTSQNCQFCFLLNVGCIFPGNTEGCLAGSL